MPAQELPARSNLDQYKKRAKELVKAAKAGDARAFADAKSRWYENADAISDFLATQNPQLRAMKQRMREYLDETLSEVTDQLSGDYARAVSDYDMVVLHVLSMSDALTAGIAE